MCGHVAYKVGLFDLQAPAITGHSTHQWLDGSPYTFQNWYKPSPQNVYHSRLFPLELEEGILQYFNPNKLQPHLETGLCVTAFQAPTIPVQWIAIPCQQKITRATFVCESNITSHEPRNTVRASRECPKKGIHFNTSCIHIVNYVYTHSYNAEEMCYAQGMSVFPLPNFLKDLDPKLGWVSWNRENFLFLKLLLSMTHRSPSLYSRDMDRIDIIVAGGQQGSEKLNMLGIQYSEASLTNVRVFNMHNNFYNFSSKTLYIVLCDGPMLISNGSCLHGHAMCDEGTCILSHYVCDGTVDCPDESDEVDCNHVCSFSDNYDININCFTSCSSPECLCNDLYFSCALGGCVPWSRVCDGVTDW